MKYLFFVVFIFQFYFGFAQSATQQCGTDEQMRAFYQSHPQAFIQAKNFDEFTRQFVNTSSNNLLNNTTLHTYTIPIVVHVLASSFYSPSATVTLAKMRTAIAKTNQDFQGSNPEIPSIDPQFAVIRQSMDIQFELAQIDPDGNPTTGVIFYPNTEKGFGNGSGYDAKIQSYAWHNYKYMNVYIMYDLYNNGVTNNSGVAWYPDTYMSDNNLARVVYNGSYIYGNVANSFAHVLSHEFGHFFNLIHTFEGACIADPALGDQVADTPPTTGSLGCAIPTFYCFSNPVNSQNFMDYNTDCYAMYTAGQVNRMTAGTLHPARQSLWQPANLTATGVDGVVRKTIGNDDSCTYTFREVYASNGTIANSITLSAKSGAHFAQSSGTWIAGTHYTIQNLPAGLTANIVIINDSSAVFTLLGTATSHSAVNSITNLKLFFLNAGIAGGVASIYNSSLNFKIVFKDGLQIVYGNNNMNTNWVAEISRCYYGTTFSFNYGSGDFGLYWLDGLRLDSHQKGVVCQTGTTNIKPLADSAVVGPASTEWSNAGASPDLHFISSATYSGWNGTINAIGVKFTDDNGNTLYGWIRLRVSNDGYRMSLVDYAYNENPGQPIVVGRGAKPILVPEFEDFLEADINDGSITTQQPYNLVGGTFAVSSGTLVNGLHYDHSAMPPGTLEPLLTVVNNKKIVLSFPGYAINHANSNNFSVSFVYHDAAFTGGNAGNVIGSNRSRSSGVFFKDPHHYENIPVQQTINAANNWYWFQMRTNLPVAYYLNSYAFWFTNNYLKLEPYEQPVVTDVATNNISLIPANTVIGPASNWNYNTASPNQPDLTSASYTAWHGQEGYIGIYTNDYYCRMYYGYLHVKVSADGKSVIFLDYAFNTKPDLPITTPYYATPVVALCPSALSSVITSDITGTTYQWQVNTGSGFNNITDNSNYTGTGTISLQLNNIPATFYGYQYRCVVNAVNSNIFIIKFVNRWTGASSTAWENPGNWSCGILPDANSEVVMDAGTVIVNSNVSVRSLLVNPAVSFTVKPAFNFTINH